MIVRCKRRKIPGDGGVVDGCGWQGTDPRRDWRTGPYCPSCGSSLLYEVVERNVMERVKMSRRLEEVIKAAAEFMEIADVPPHLRNSQAYLDRRAVLKTVASLRLSELLPPRDGDEEELVTDLLNAAEAFIGQNDVVHTTTGAWLINATQRLAKQRAEVPT